MKIQNEQTVIASDNDILTLTNYRVKLEEKNGSKSRFISITLDSVSSCGLTTQDRPIFLYLAAISFFIALASFASKFEYAPLMITFGIVFSVAYKFTQSGVITIYSNGTDSIAVPTKGINRDVQIKFVESVTQEKLKFIGKIDH